MPFTGIHYYGFLAVSILLMALLESRGRSAAKLLLIILSYAFYASFSTALAALLLVTTVIDFHLLKGIVANRWKKTLVACSVAVNFAPLLWLKLSPEGVPQILTGQMSFVIPVGVSFYTFKSVSYLIDAYRGNSRPADFADFALYLSFFPAILCGPVSRFGQFQDDGFRGVRSNGLFEGFELIVRGLFKKAVIADGIHYLIAPVAGTEPAHLTASILAMTAMTVQLYCDFSGYTDIARGSARCLGFELPENFGFSLLAPNIAEFWRRQHITLSTWFRDYVYLPVLKIRWLRPQARIHLGLVLTFLLSGLWHGFYPGAWLFGLSQILFFFIYLHSAGLRRRLPVFFAWLATHFCVILSVSLLTSPSNAFTLWLLNGLGRFEWGAFEPRLISAGLIAYGFIAWQLCEASHLKFSVEGKAVPVLKGISYAAALVLALLASGNSTAFLYTRF